MSFDRYENFTDRGLEVMDCCHDIARRLGHEYVATEHVLLALIEVEQGVAANLLKNRGVTADAVLRETRRFTSDRTPGEISDGRLPRTPRVLQVIEWAKAQAQALGLSFIGTEHLLLALAQEQEGVAARVLANLGVTLANVKADVLHSMTPAPLPHAFAPLDEVLSELEGGFDRALADSDTTTALWFLGLQVKLTALRKRLVAEPPSETSPTVVIESKKP